MSFLRSHLPKDPVFESQIAIAQLYRKVFLDSPEGQLVLDHLLQTLCGLHAPIVVEKDEMGTLVRAARHDVGAHILRLVYAPIDDKKPTVRRSHAN